MLPVVGIPSLAEGLSERRRGREKESPGKTSMELLKIILGLILLVFGRKLFWLFVAIAGFMVGMEFVAVILADQPPWIVLVLALGAGLLGALLAVFAQRVAFALAGFYAGAYLALILAQSFFPAGDRLVFFAVGGVIGGVFAALVVDQTIILLSCLVGAGAIVEALGMGKMVSIIVFVVLVATGAWVQARVMNRSAPKV